MKTLNLKYLSLMTLLSVLLVTSGCNRKSDSGAELGKAKADSQTLIKENVETTTATKVSLPKTIFLTGTLAADEQSNVAAKRGGIIKEVLIDRGSVVKRNDVMVKLDTTDAVNSLNQTEASASELLVRLGLKSTSEKFDPSKQPDVKVAKAALELATQNFNRDKSLNSSKVISTEEFDKTRNIFNTASQNYDLAVAQANQLYRQFQTALTKVKSGRQFLEDMNVKAPFDGAVIERVVAPGESLNDGARIATLVRINPLRLQLNVPEQAVGKIATGQKVDFTVDSFPGEKFSGIIRRISPSLDPETRTLTVEAEVPNKNQVLKPGLFASAQVELDAERKGVSVPAGALRRTDDFAQVFVVTEGIARAQMVVPGETKKGRTEIVSGLKGGEQIVSNADQIQDGTRIQ